MVNAIIKGRGGFNINVVIIVHFPIEYYAAIVHDKFIWLMKLKKV